MASTPLPLTLAFGYVPPQPHDSLASSLGLPSAYFFVHDLDILAVGFTSGAILLFKHNENGIALKAYLNGHKSAIVAITVAKINSANAGSDVILLSLSLDGQVRKWDARDGRCLLVADSNLHAPPKGLQVVCVPPVSPEGKVRPAHWMTDFYVLVYGSSTAISVLSLTTLGTSVRWTGHIDWPMPLSFDGDGFCLVFTVHKSGVLQPWKLTKTLSSNVDISKLQESAIMIGDSKLGAVLSVQKLADTSDADTARILVAQKHGLSIYTVDRRKGGRLSFVQSLEEVDELIEVIIHETLISCRLHDGSVTVYDKELETLQKISTGGSVDRVLYVFSKNSISASDVSAVAFHINKDGTSSIISGEPTDEPSNFRWNYKDSNSHESLRTKNPQIVQSNVYTQFGDYYVFTQGRMLSFYSLERFLLQPKSPDHTIELPDLHDEASVLQTINLGRTAASDRMTYLVVGLLNGGIYLIDAKTFQLSPCVSLHAGPIAGVFVLPADLAPRLRSTLLVFSNNGSSSVVDVIPSTGGSTVCKARTLLTLPCSMSSGKLECVATQKGKNLLLLIDKDGRKRIWDVDSSDGGILVNDNESRNSFERYKASMHGEIDPELEDMDSSKEPWREQWAAFISSNPVQEQKFVQTEVISSHLHDYLTMTANFYQIVTSLQKRYEQTPKFLPLEHDDDSLTSLRAAITALALLLGWRSSKESGAEIDILKDAGLGSAGILLPFEISNLSVGQCGESGSLSLLRSDASETTENSISYRWSELTPALKSTAAITICSLLLTLIHLTTPLDMVLDGEQMLRSVIRQILSQDRDQSEAFTLDLSLLCEYYTDDNSWVQSSSKICLDVEIGLMSIGEIARTFDYWQDFLPTQIAPELFSERGVLKAVIVLSILIIILDRDKKADFKIDRSLRRNVALSIELFLTDSDPLYQDTAINLVSDGWLSWQSEFDSFEVIHILMRILATPSLSTQRRLKIDSAFIKIAAKNAPLLASGLANCISHAVPEKGSAFTTLTETINLSIAAKKTVVSIVRDDPHLFAEPELIKVIMDAIVRILDPQGGQIRDRVLQHVTEVVNEVVDAYPTVAFHRPSQKLAITSSPRSVTIYDLNNAKPVASLEGQSRIAQFLTFSQDGKLVVAADLEDSQLLVWKLATGIFSSFIGAAANIGVLGTEGVTVIQLKGKYSFKNPKNVGTLRIEFSGERTVKVTAGLEVTTIAV